MTGPWLRVVLHLRDRHRRLVDAADVYYMEAVGDETAIRLRGARPLRDVRSLGEVVRALQSLGFVRIHRNTAVNLRHVRELRPSAGHAGWEVRLEPPVNRVLPVSRAGYDALLSALRRTQRARG